ncbi:unnamed protein product [Closterium sp. NIES-65]|nr:unnamed protein product [Closterium sp. NIES-65]
MLLALATASASTATTTAATSSTTPTPAAASSTATPTTASTPATSVAATTPTATTRPSSRATTPTASTAPTAASPAVTATTLAPFALAAAAPARGRRNADLLSTKKVDSSSRGDRGKKGGRRTPLKERGTGVATRGTYSDYASLSCKQLLLEEGNAIGTAEIAAVVVGEAGRTNQVGQGGAARFRSGRAIRLGRAARLGVRGPARGARLGSRGSVRSRAAAGTGRPGPLGAVGTGPVGASRDSGQRVGEAAWGPREASAGPIGA